MNTVKVTYFNDTQALKYVLTPNLSNIKEVGPLGRETFEIEVPEEHNLFIKEWSDGTILLSTIKN